MSRIGKLPISIPTGVTVTLKDNVVTVKGPKGELSQFVDPSINVSIEDGHVMLTENENAMLDNVKQRHAFMACIVLWLTTWLLVFLKVIRKNWNLSV